MREFYKNSTRCFPTHVTRVALISARLIGVRLPKSHRTQDLEEVVVVISPDMEARRNGNGFEDGGGFEIVEKTGIAGHEHPVRGVDQLAEIVPVGDQAGRITGVVGKKLHDRREVQISVRGVNGQDSAGP